MGFCGLTWVQSPPESLFQSENACLLLGSACLASDRWGQGPVVRARLSPGIYVVPLVGVRTTLWV